MVPLNVYAHLFEDALDRLSERLDASHFQRQTASRRPGLGHLNGGFPSLQNRV
jgi:hypothetical protein